MATDDSDEIQPIETSGEPVTPPFEIISRPKRNVKPPPPKLLPEVPAKKAKAATTPKAAAAAAAAAQAAPPPEPDHKAAAAPAADGTPPAAPAPKKKGRTVGAGNYTLEDLQFLVGILEEVPPIGSPSWEDIAQRFNTLAKAAGRPVRDADALHKKYMKMLKDKPTGVGDYSPIQKRFRAVEANTHRSTGGAILVDSFGSDNDSHLSENAVNDVLADVDGIETARTKARGVQTLARLANAVNTEDASSSASSSTPAAAKPGRRVKSPNMLTLLLQQQERSDKRWEQLLQLRAEEQKAERELADAREERLFKLFALNSKLSH